MAILKMVEDGRITPEEADTLLQALGSVTGNRISEWQFQSSFVPKPRAAAHSHLTPAGTCGRWRNWCLKVFADELDDRGRSALREMEFAGRLSPFLGGLTSLALFSDDLYGYVWTEDGRVVGNVSLQQGDESGLRWRISNVAVLPEYRGRGIARTLMQETLREIARRAGAWTILQVRAGNEVAHRLYLALGFVDVCRDGLWRLPAASEHPPGADPAVPLEPLRTLTGSEWLESGARGPSATGAVGRAAQPC